MTIGKIGALLKTLSYFKTNISPKHLNSQQTENCKQCTQDYRKDWCFIQKHSVSFNPIFHTHTNSQQAKNCKQCTQQYWKEWCFTQNTQLPSNQYFSQHTHKFTANRQLQTVHPGLLKRLVLYSKHSASFKPIFHIHTKDWYGYSLVTDSTLRFPQGEVSVPIQLIHVDVRIVILSLLLFVFYSSW